MVAAGGLESGLNTAVNAAPLMIAPRAIIKCFEAACSNKSFREGLAVEMEQFTNLVFSVESAALRHLFLSERLAQKADLLVINGAKRPCDVDAFLIDLLTRCVVFCQAFQGPKLLKQAIRRGDVQGTMDGMVATLRRRTRPKEIRSLRTLHDATWLLD
eukprot:symbB.v1.2.007340.t1/scaffold425.1/size368629/4